MKFDRILFDSEINDWQIESSQFDKRIYGKQNIIILMEDNEMNMFGCYINAKIDKYQYIENDEWKGGRITDKNAFIFSLKSNGRFTEPIAFDIFEQCSDWAFILFKSDLETLFSVGGGCDITIAKQNIANSCSCIQHSFNYRNLQNVLVGKTGDDNSFTIQRIRVLQMIK